MTSINHLCQDNVVVFSKVHKAFSGQVVLNQTHLEVPRGKLTFIIGRSGEGKSVILKHIVGILTPDSGDIWVLGEHLSRLSAQGLTRLRQKIGLLFQDGALLDGLSVFENIALGLREFGHMSLRELELKVEDLLNQVGLPHILGRFPYELSIGEKKRVGLARALALNPRMILYDEPTTSMDPLVCERIDELIVNTHQKGQTADPAQCLTSVVVSHDIDSVLRIAEHVIMLHKGQVYFSGTASELSKTADPLLRQFLSGSAEGPLNRA